MRIRHKTPSIFNLSMVDVLCCALGCVILLWLLNLREAKTKAAQAGRADEEVSSLKRRISALSDELSDLRARYAASVSQAGDTDRDLKATRVRLNATEEEARKSAVMLAQLEKLLASLRVEKEDKERELALRVRSFEELEAKLKLALARGEELAGVAKEARTRASTEEALARGLEKEMAQRGGELTRLRDELFKARGSLTTLESEKAALVGEAARLRAAGESRFAGIALSGRRVVLLVDMSGSMRHIDEKTEAPSKWPGVAEAVGKIMRSLPDLEKFQVIAFSEGVVYPLGGKGQWFDADRGAADRVVEALKKTNPEGGTNMFLALEAAFAYRDQGLDTIYLFSDGLPNQGPDLTNEDSRTLTTTALAEKLAARIRRKLQADWNADKGKRRVSINAVGFFYESPDVGAFLWALARENDGSFVGMSKP